MPIPTKEADIVESRSQALEPTLEPNAALMFERLARDPNVDVDKLERLIAMQERILKHQAKAAFDAAFAEMQADIPTIIEHGKTDKGSFAELSDIVEAIRPVLRLHGFALSHRTEWPDKSTVKVVGVLTHREGHSRESEFMAGADTSGSKNAIQALGSAVSYGRRYTTKDLLNITSKQEDDDGKAAGRKQHHETPQAPGGFDDWLSDLQAVVDEGWDALKKTWNASPLALRNHLAATDKDMFENLKRKAVAVTKGQAK